MLLECRLMVRLYMLCLYFGCDLYVYNVRILSHNLIYCISYSGMNNTMLPFQLAPAAICISIVPDVILSQHSFHLYHTYLQLESEGAVH